MEHSNLVCEHTLIFWVLARPHLTWWQAQGSTVVIRGAAGIWTAWSRTLHSAASTLQGRTTAFTPFFCTFREYVAGHFGNQCAEWWSDLLVVFKDFIQTFNSAWLRGVWILPLGKLFPHSKHLDGSSCSSPSSWDFCFILQHSHIYMGPSYGFWGCL